MVLHLNGGQKKKSKTIAKTLNPDFSEWFYFDVGEPTDSHVLLVEVFDKDTLSSDFLCSAEFSLSAEDFHDETEKKKTLLMSNAKKPTFNKGEVIISYCIKEGSAGEEEDKKKSTIGLSGLGIKTMINSAATKAKNLQRDLLSTAADVALSNTKYFKHTKWDAKGKEGKGKTLLITVDIIEARGIPPMDDNGLADVYCNVKFGKFSKRTRTKFKTLHPKWQEEFVFEKFDLGGVEDPRLFIDLYDQDFLTTDEGIGYVEINILEECATNVTTEKYFPINPPHKHKKKNFDLSVYNSVSRPELLLIIHVHDLFSPTVSKKNFITNNGGKLPPSWLRCHVFRAVELLPMDSNGLSDPFISINVGNTKVRTDVQYKTLNPTFDCMLEMPITDVFETLVLHCYDDDGKGKYQEIGYVKLNLLALKSGQKTWLCLRNHHQKVAGYVKVAFHLDMEFLPAMAGLIKRKQIVHMNAVDKFKTTLLKHNAERIKRPILALLPPIVFIVEVTKWQHHPAYSVLFTVGCVLFFLFFQPFLIPLCLGLGCLGIWIVKRIKKKRLVEKLLSEDELYDEFTVDEEDDFESSSEEDEDQPPEQAALPQGKKRSKKPTLRQQLQQLTEILRLVQNTLGDIASNMERMKNLYNWNMDSPHISMMFALGMLLAAFVMYYVSVRYLLCVFIVNKMTRAGLRKYHPKFQRSKYYKPIIEALEALKKVPDDKELKELQKLRVPESIKKLDDLNDEKIKAE